MSEWKTARLTDIAAPGGLAGGPFGSSLGTRDYVDAGVPVIRGSNLGSSLKFDPSDFVYVSKEKAFGELSRNLAIPGDVVFTQRGTLGQVGLVPSSPYSHYVISQSQMRLRPNQDLALAEFIYYQFKTPNMIREINNRAITTGVPHINLGILAALEVPLPDLAEQRAVIAILAALDDKIAANDQIAAKARELGICLVEESISRGSQQLKLGSLAAYVSRGVAPRYSDDESELLVLNQKCIRGGRVSLDTARRTIAGGVPSQKMLEMNDVLVNSTGVGTLGRVARWTGSQLCTADSHVTIVRFDEAHADPVVAGLAMIRAEREIEALGEGSTGQTELSRLQLWGLSLTLPPKGESARLRPILDNLEKRADCAMQESASLGRLRDALLLRLMSGEIQVRAAEKIVEDVT